MIFKKIFGFLLAADFAGFCRIQICVDLRNLWETNVPFAYVYLNMKIRDFFFVAMVGLVDNFRKKYSSDFKTILPTRRSNDIIFYQMIQEKELTTGHYKKLKEVLGKKYIKDDLDSPFDFIHIAKKGINVNVVKNFRTYFGLPRDITAEMLNISEPTLYRWTKANRNLEKNYMIKLFDIADLFLYGIEVFENKDNFFKWLNLPNTALGGLNPIELIEIPDGVSKVRDIIGRIEHGVYS